MNNNQYKLAAILLGIALLFSLGTCYHYYQQVQLYKVNQDEFAEYQQHKQEQQQKLQKLLEDNEKMLRDITEITNLEKKLRRAIIRDSEANKLGSNLGLNTDSTESSSAKSGYVGGSKGQMTGMAALNAIAAQNKNISMLISDTKSSVSDLLGAMEGRSGTLASFPNKWPVNSTSISSNYGHRIDPISSGSEWHEGIDIPADFGSPVYASAAGTVEFADWNGGYGRYVRIDHGNGYKTAYGHMSGLATTSGHKVAKGEIIGFVGSSGYSTGPHVHFEVISEGQAIDPFYVLKK